MKEVSLEGKLENKSGSCPTVTFKVGGDVVYTTSVTKYERGECKDLRDDAKVDVRGMLMSDGRVRADRVKFEKGSIE